MAGRSPDTEPTRRALRANEDAEEARRRVGDARERGSQVRERAQQISERLHELSTQTFGPATPTSAGVLAAEEAMRHSALAAERARQLALEAFEHAALAEESVARNHDLIADNWEERAREAAPEQREPFLQRVAEQRAKAAHRRHEAAVDREAAEKLRRNAPPPDAEVPGP